MEVRIIRFRLFPKNQIFESIEHGYSHFTKTTFLQSRLQSVVPQITPEAKACSPIDLEENILVSTFGDMINLYSINVDFTSI